MIFAAARLPLGAVRRVTTFGEMPARHILLVEDNGDDEALALRALQRVSETALIEVARDGAAALDRLLAKGAFAGARLPEVVLLDLQLPKLSGLDVLRAVRADGRARRVPVVVLTSSSEDRDIAASYDAGANGYVRKPVQFEAYLRAVAELGAYWLDLNESPVRAPGVR